MKNSFVPAASIAAVVLIGLWLGRPLLNPTQGQSSGSAVNRPPARSTVSPSPEATPPLTDPRVQSAPALADPEAETIALFRRTSPSVVHITTANVRRDFFSMNMQKIPSGSGTGFVWDDNGHIVTNFHVIREADTATVAFDDQTSYPATLVGTAPEKDLAVLKIEIDAGSRQPIPLGRSADLEVGRTALAIGNPFGLDQTLTTGVVSALGREIKSLAGVPIRDVIQTDAAINPGNSGGPLLDRRGRLIGVNTAIYSPSGTYAGIGFAIPVDTVSWVVPELIEHGRVRRPGLDVTYAADSIRRRLRLPEGVLVLDVAAGSAAEKAGLRPSERTRGGIKLGDLIIEIDGQPVRSTSDLVLIFEGQSAGQTVPVVVRRGNSTTLVPVELEMLDG